MHKVVVADNGNWRLNKPMPITPALENSRQVPLFWLPGIEKAAADDSGIREFKSRYAGIFKKPLTIPAAIAF